MNSVYLTHAMSTRRARPTSRPTSHSVARATGAIRRAHDAYARRYEHDDVSAQLGAVLGAECGNGCCGPPTFNTIDEDQLVLCNTVTAFIDQRLDVPDCLDKRRAWLDVRRETFDASKQREQIDEKEQVLRRLKFAHETLEAELQPKRIQLGALALLIASTTSALDQMHAELRASSITAARECPY